MLANHKSATDDLISLPAYISWYATRPTGKAHGKLLHLFKLLCNPPPMKASWLKHNFPYNERSKELGKKRDWMSIRLVGIDRMSWFSKYIIKLVNSNLGIRLNCLYNYHPTFISHIILNITAFSAVQSKLFFFLFVILYSLEYKHMLIDFLLGDHQSIIHFDLKILSSIT